MIFHYICNVFHGIRFKVNKEWDTAVSLFLCVPLKSPNEFQRIMTAI